MAKSNKLKKYIIFIAVAFILVTAMSMVKDNVKGPKPNDEKADKIVVHFLDVGQGDCEFIELPSGECMLIDASTLDYGDKIVSVIKNLGYSKIDYVVATHPHADHIGGMKVVINSFNIGKIYMPKVSSNTKTFEGLLTAIKDNGLSINTAKSKTQIYSDNNLSIEILSPISSSYDELNNYSSVVMLKYGDSSFLFMGDAEKLVENELIDKYGYDLDVDVLKAGHHGSRYSSSEKFLNVVSPTYAIISCGRDNSYGHPHKEAIKRLKSVGADTLCTYELGNITVSCDDNDRFDVSCD